MCVFACLWASDLSDWLSMSFPPLRLLLIHLWGWRWLYSCSSSYKCIQHTSLILPMKGYTTLFNKAVTKTLGLSREDKQSNRLYEQIGWLLGGGGVFLREVSPQWEGRLLAVGNNSWNEPWVYYLNLPAFKKKLLQHTPTTTTRRLSVHCYHRNRDGVSAVESVIPLQWLRELAAEPQI